MSHFTDIFIRRPVLSTVVSLLILALGVRALLALPVRQFPKTENSTIQVTTVYYGADPDVVAGFITQPIENAVSQADGIDYITSESASSVSTITATLQLNYNADKALTEISTKVSSITNQLPPQSQQPQISISTGQSAAAMYIGFRSALLKQNQITDYITRVVQPQLQSVPGVQGVQVFGGQNFAMRIWLDPKRLAAYGLTASDVNLALATNDYISGLGNTKGQMVAVNLNASTSLHSLDEFQNLVIRQTNGAIIRLKDVANVVLGADNYDARVTFDGINSVVIAVNTAPNSNLIDVLARINKVFPQIIKQLPEGLEGKVVYDSSKFVDSAINEVEFTLFQALFIVTLVVFAFLGSLRSVAIPVIAIPLSIIGTFVMMVVAGFTINLLTLLAMVLAIGLVVDDAIIVVENCNRHLSEGMKPIDAAIQAARELGGPIIAMTVVLIAVYVPIGFQGGLTGALFTEFAFTLVGTVTVSAIVALTLSPMMCSRLLKLHGPATKTAGWQDKFGEYIDHIFEWVRSTYERLLHGSLNLVVVTATFAVLVLGSIYFLYSFSRHELAPQEDQGFILGFVQSAPNATLQQRVLYSDSIFQTLRKYPEIEHIFQVDAPGSGFLGLVLKPWDERSRSSSQLTQLASGDLSQYAGVQAAVFQPPSLPGGFGTPIQFEITTTHSFDRLYDVTQQFLTEARKSGRFIFVDTGLKIDQPQATVEIDRNKAAMLGLTMADIGASMSAMLGGGYVNYFSLDGRSYRVMSQVQQEYRLNPDQVLDYYVRASNGTLVPLSTVAKISTKTVPESLSHFQQQNAATISGVMMPGQTLGDTLAYMQDLAHRILPDGFYTDTAGQSRQFYQESSGFLNTFGFALIIIFLALAALFESFRDPLIILISVPMSIAGAMIFICLGIGGTSLNIYTEVGLVTLMGLISKHGILIVEFANRLQQEGLSKREAVEAAAGIRLRPILMTTAAMVLGVAPLLLATGAGAAARFAMGLVISTGISIGTLFTLFVVPAVYLLIAEDHSKTRVAARTAAART